MNQRLAELLVCPIDRTPLELVAWESGQRPLSDDTLLTARRLNIDPQALASEITTGVLVNRARGAFYPIYNGVPRLLVFPTALTRRFVTEFHERIDRDLPGYQLPNEAAEPGEADVLRSFSREWLSYDWDSRSYWDLTAEDLYRSTRFMLDLDRRPIRDQLVLEVGIGIGGIADHLVRREGCELVGTDLSYAVDAAYRSFGGNRLFHIVQASLFAPPFREDTFDLVFSHGVLHHTFSTKAAFEHICRLPKGQGRLYVWVYSWQQERRTPARRALMLLERLLRPLLWRLPESLQTVALLPLACVYLLEKHLPFRRAASASGKYGWREALHAVRDRFTPRYAHRHSDEEVTAWFGAAGYTDVQCVSQRQGPDFVPVHFLACAGVDGTRGVASAAVA